VRDRVAVLRFAVDFFAAVFRFAGARFAAVFRFGAAFRFAVDFLAAVFRFGADFLLTAVFFFAAVFFAPDFLAEDVRDVELLEELREPERDEDRVRAGMAATGSAISCESPAADSPHVSPAACADGSLNKPADVCDDSPVSLQSSWVTTDLLGRFARARFPTTFVCIVQRGRTTSSARC